MVLAIGSTCWVKTPLAWPEFFTLFSRAKCNRPLKRAAARSFPAKSAAAESTLVTSQVLCATAVALEITDLGLTQSEPCRCAAQHWHVAGWAKLTWL